MKDHLEGCAECRKLQEQMQQEIKIVDLPEAQIDYLKGIKKHLSRKASWELASWLQPCL